MSNINITSGSASSPYLEVIEQESISIENAIINNRNSNVHIVVKNTSFVLKIKSLDISKVNFSSSCVKAGLYYVGDPLKEVSFIQNPPITYVGSSCKNGEQFAIDIKISILSSQHQGNLFYILVTASPDASNKNGATHTVLSFPIRVVSKVDHIKKDPNGVCEKKQTFIDVLTDRLTTLERIHQDQSTLLSKMLKERGIQAPPVTEYSSYTEYTESDLLSCGFSTSPPSSPFSISDSTSISSTSTSTTATTSLLTKKHKKHVNGGNALTINNNINTHSNKNTAEKFLESFNKVIKVYKEDNYGKKTLELSNFISGLEYDEKNILVDLLESFTFDESSQVKSNPSSSDHNEDCNCETCPYKQQAEQFMLLSPVVCFPSPAIKPTVPSPTNQI
ncbi:hypothetical protein DICPUDRAFT_55408 [Dictyostelium purpureum]|uniref:Uncharacterized protein n=1 Tax=Dictyostelium purpureum TaxID=5786 RepID=F0ZLY2_DICPU|nr:uncharacterized protein DICPUDRAFT_55408 [Dictyostelium purpureum]EGC35046.1 hypothetical protein DICPUDRAFT_55408 [Dictyostelium purpureum]|eukprot:XP_003288414.1 hypothetical protein DICPUDRAFT_55408 [Dictyostelium purpureum]